MKFIGVRDLRTRPGEVWKELETDRELVVTNNGRPIALLTPLCEDDLEETLRALRSARAAAALASMRKKAAEMGKSSFSEEEINDEIRKYRASR